MRRPKPSPIAIFAISAIVLLLVLTLAWSTVSKWTSRPVAVLVALVLENTSGWVHSTREAPGVLEVESEFEVLIPGAGGHRAALVFEGNPARYAYGLPIFLALLLAARGPRRLPRAVIGAVLLLPAQAFSLCLSLLVELMSGAQGSLAILKVAPWQLELVAYGYQLGSLVLPTLTPVVLWLWLDRQFVAEVLVKGWTKRQAVVA
ncbi:MAG: hypothetical protein JWP29_3203 [Rhodoferax sp.]|nr:hypothetical protein [Rhodoferax sp.]